MSYKQRAFSSKGEARAHFKQLRKNITHETHLSASKEVCQNIAKLIKKNPWKNVLFFYPIYDEINILGTFSYLAGEQVDNNPKKKSGVEENVTKESVAKEGVAKESVLESYRFSLPCVIDEGVMITKEVPLVIKHRQAQREVLANRPAIEWDPSALESHPKLPLTQPKMSAAAIKEERKLLASSGRAFDLVLTPGLAFDRRGYRLGYGGGYYDRFFASGHYRISHRLGVCLENQCCEKLPTEDNDIPVDGIITEKRVLFFNQ